jgi:hypothetical protein
VRASSRRTGTTVLAVVGDTLDEGARCVRRLATAVNVSELVAGADDPPLVPRVLHAAAPARVVPAAGADDALDRLARLPTGRWWPDLDDLLAGIEHVVPDRAGLDQPVPGQLSPGSSARIE